MHRRGPAREPDSGTLELFLLCLMDRGLATPYDFQSRADLSLGAVIPALRRLLAKGHVAKVEQGRQHRYSVSPSGRKLLVDAPATQLPREVAGEYDAILRTACLLDALGGGERSPADFLKRASRIRQRLADARRDEADGMMDAKNRKAVAAKYRWMRAISDSLRLSAEAKALRKIAVSFSGRSAARKN